MSCRPSPSADSTVPAVSQRVSAGVTKPTSTLPLLLLLSASSITFHCLPQPHRPPHLGDVGPHKKSTVQSSAQSYCSPIFLLISVAPVQGLERVTHGYNRPVNVGPYGGYPAARVQLSLKHIAHFQHRHQEKRLTMGTETLTSPSRTNFQAIFLGNTESTATERCSYRNTSTTYPQKHHPIMVAYDLCPSSFAENRLGKIPPRGCVLSNHTYV